ncbi:MAG TPA: gliding motility-associated C-terminal domain-containing protein [Cytophagales bacterium]|nr:gliding motility-associated C-terminal domain-containing protein [Cytophagales bacterium]
MLKLRLPFYKIYFYFLIVLITGSIFASSNWGGIVRANILGFQGDSEGFDEEGNNIKGKKAFFLPSYDDDSTEHIAFTQTCFQSDDSTQFFAITDENVERYSWNFGTGLDADTSDQRNPYFYFQEGEYTVTLKYFKTDGTVVTVDTTVTVVPDISALPDLGVDTAICPEQFPWALNPYTSGASPSGATYIWSTGDTTATIDVDSAGNYWVAVTVGGCTRIDEVEVTEYAKPRRRAAIWYFGTNAGIDFNQDPPQSLNDAPLLNAPEGTSAISDIDGKLIFYTDGQTVFNKNHEVMDNGRDVGGSPNSTQSSIIMPWPGRMPYYFLFTTEDVTSTEKRLMVSLIDMKGGENAEGEVVYKNNILDEPTSERLTAYALKNSAGADSIYWLVSQENSTGAFKVFQIDSTGIHQPPTEYPIGTPQTGDNEAQGTMKISSTGDYLAVAAGDRVEVYNFNDSTGEISDSVVIQLDGTGPAYGVEFSPDGGKLYVTNATGLYQYDITDTLGNRLPNDSIRAENHRDTIATGTNFGALQLAPDNSIYMAVDGATSLGVINNPTGDGDEVDFQLAGFDLNGGISTKGLPNFVQSFFEPPQGPSLGYQDACGPGPIDLFASGWGDRDDFEWTVDGSTRPKQRMLTQITEDLSLGSHTVSVRITNDCNMDTTLAITFTVVGGPQPVNLPDDYTICEGDQEVLDAGPINEASERYLWSTGDSTRTITVNSPGRYAVFVIKDNGCFEGDVVNLLAPTIGDITGDTVLCQGQVSRLTTGSPSLAHVWRDGNGNQISTNNYLDVSTSGIYSVDVSYPNGCTDTDEVTVVVSPRPLVNPVIAVAPTCNESNGRIVLNKTTDNAYPDYTYQWFDQNNQVIAGATTNTLDRVGAGVYRVSVTHPQGCDSVWTIPVNPNNVTIDVPPPGSIVCSAGGTNVNVTINGGAPNYTLEMYRQDNDQLYTSRASQSSSNWTLFSVPEGIFYIAITDANGCIYSKTDIIVEPNPSRPVIQDLGPDKFSCNPMEAINAEDKTAAPDNYVYSWEAFINGVSAANAIASGQNEPSMVAQNPTPTSTSQIKYVLTVNNGDCILKDSLTVNFSPFQVTLPENVTRCAGEGNYVIRPTFIPAATSSQTQNYFYMWEKTDAPVKVFSTRASTLSVDQSGTYKVTVVNNQSGCTAEDEMVVTINPAPTDKLGADITDKCEGETVQLDAGYPDGTVTWTGPGVSPGTNTRLINVTEEGQYIATINLDGCERPFDILVIFKEAPGSGLVEDLVNFCSSRQNTVTLTAGRNVTNRTYIWTDSATKATLGNEYNLKVNQAGTYIVEINDPNVNCITRDTVRVVDECENHIFVPNAFSPNGDTNNDFLEFKGEPVAFFDVSIFNRWGQLIYHSNNKESGWNGRTMSNKEAPPGTYVYTIVYRSLKGDQNIKFTKKGAVVLIR